jgi:hypothetical protein
MCNLPDGWIPDKILISTRFLLDSLKKQPAHLSPPPLLRKAKKGIANAVAAVQEQGVHADC